MEKQKIALVKFDRPRLLDESFILGEIRAQKEVRI
tara:strand:- start:160 stop:264 length:105 start_codon:yes stop_codon:yes gene_type:complete